MPAEGRCCDPRARREVWTKVVVLQVERVKEHSAVGRKERGEPPGLDVGDWTDGDDVSNQDGTKTLSSMLEMLSLRRCVQVESAVSTGDLRDGKVTSCRCVCRSYQGKQGGAGAWGPRRPPPCSSAPSTRNPCWTLGLVTRVPVFPHRF